MLDVSIELLEYEFGASLEALRDLEIDSIVNCFEAVLHGTLVQRVFKEGVVHAEYKGRFLPVF